MRNKIALLGLAANTCGALMLVFSTPRTVYYPNGGSMVLITLHGQSAMFLIAMGLTICGFLMQTIGLARSS
jgi:hypothetical protein